jgi:RNA recognition motif-containing protein
MKIFSSFGDIESLVILKSKDPSRTQGCGFVKFASVSDAAKAIHDLNGKYVVESVCLLYLPVMHFLRILVL